MRHFFFGLFVFTAGAGAASAQQPVTVTSTGEFQKGNNEGLARVAQDQVARAPISAGSLEGWTGTGDLPFGRVSPAVVHGSRLYVIGGTPDGYSVTDDVAGATIEADGDVGSWTSTASLLTARGAHGAVAYNGFAYAIGGSTDFTNALSSVEFAKVNADGSLGVWSTTSALPSGRLYHSCFAYNGFVYCVGGFDSNGDSLNQVLYAPVRADGTLGAWTPTTSLPGGRLYHSTVVTGGFAYVIGGVPDDGGDPYGDSLVAPLNDDGTVGAWTSTSGLEADRRWQSATVMDGYVYAVGGYNSLGAMSGVDAAPVNPDGTLGAWSPVDSLSSGRLFATAIAANGRLYALGGFDDSFGLPSEVVTSAIDAGGGQTLSLLRGEFSFLVDLGADSPTQSIVIGGSLSPGGVIRVQVRVAPDATGIFGAETVVDDATPGVAIPVQGDGRHVWIRLTLDDTGTTDSAQPTIVTDVTVMPFEPPATGVVNDGSGADVDTQTSTTTIQANWTGFTPGPGDPIAYYEWAIGSAPGSTNLQFWTNVGLATSGTNAALSLAPGTKFVSVRATSASGLKSAVAVSDGVQVQGSGAPSSDDDDKGRCENAASAAPAPGAALLGILLFASAVVRRRLSIR
jgi:hypothetical protein